jgi:hypothetical protein
VYLLQIEWWVFILIGWSLAFFVLPFVRKLREGLAYSLSYSAVWGDVAFAFLVAEAAVASERQTSGVLIFDIWFNVLLIVGCVALGLFLFFGTDGHQTFVDGLHNFFMVPLYGYLVVISFLVLVQSGEKVNYFAAIAAPTFWGMLVLLDFEEDNMNQKAKVKREGVTGIRGLQWLMDAMNGGARAFPQTER